MDKHGHDHELRRSELRTIARALGMTYVHNPAKADAEVHVEARETVFNHVGLCVTDIQRARTFYEDALGFTFWWELDEAPEEDAAKLLQLGTPLELHGVYLIRDGFVLELLHYHDDLMQPGRVRSMAEPGLTHISVTVGNIAAALERIERCGGTVLHDTNTGPAVMVRDPDGQLIELLDPSWYEWLPPRPI